MNAAYDAMLTSSQIHWPLKIYEYCTDGLSSNYTLLRQFIKCKISNIYFFKSEQEMVKTFKVHNTAKSILH